MWEVQREAENNLQCEVVSRTDSNCVPKLAGNEVKVKEDNCTKNPGKTSVPVNTICRKNCRKFSERARHDNRNDKLR